MNRIEVLDVTLRDGGCVNNFEFGQLRMTKILSSLENAGVDIIELGYIDDKNGSISDRTQYIDECAIENQLLKTKKTFVEYVAMIDYGKYDFNRLPERSKNSIDGLRVAFHKNDLDKIEDISKIIINKGYNLYIQPMLTLRYSDNDLNSLIKIANRLEKVRALYIVDSFGEMRSDDLSRIFEIVNNKLNKNICIGFHSHNNLQLSYSNAIKLLEMNADRNVIIDSSIMGMGKGAGNLNTELLIEHLNLFYGKKYQISPLLNIIDKVINPIHSELYWGYAPEYYLSSINHCSPSYASYFYNKHMLSIDKVSELLSKINEDKKISFDKEYAENLYREFNEKLKIDDNESFLEIKKELNGKTVLLVAPGKSIKKVKDKLSIYSTKKDVITIGLNTNLEFNDFIITTRNDVFEEAVKANMNIIVCSNISKNCRGKILVLDYSNWTDVINGCTFDSSSIIAFNLIKKCGVKKVLMAGFDGFSSLSSNNYFDSSLDCSISNSEAQLRNKFYKDYFKKVRESGIELVFLTKSLYR